MDETAALDAAHRAMLAAPDDDAARLAYYHGLAQSELCLLLDREPSGDDLDPRVLTTTDGPLLLAFDSEDRLAAAANRPQPYAALPGRVILALMAGRGLSLGLNLGVADSAFLMPPATVDWIAAHLAERPAPATTAPTGWSAPAGGANLARRLSAALAGMGAHAARAWLATARHADGTTSPSLVIEAADPAAEPALAKAAADALAFSGQTEGRADIFFLTAAEVTAAALGRIAQPVPLSRPAPPEPAAAPAAPGSDPARPPRLR